MTLLFAPHAYKGSQSVIIVLIAWSFYSVRHYLSLFTYSNIIQKYDAIVLLLLSNALSNTLVSADLLNLRTQDLKGLRFEGIHHTFSVCRPFLHILRDYPHIRSDLFILLGQVYENKTWN